MRLSSLYHPYLEVMANPLSAPLEGAHPPDSNTRPTIVWRLKQSKTVTSVGSAHLWEIRPWNYLGWAQAPVTSESTTTLSGVSWDDSASVASSFSYYRPMALVVEMEYVGPADAAQGTMFVVESDRSIPNGTALSSLTDEPHYMEGSITNGTGVACVIRYNYPTWTATGSEIADANGVAKAIVGVTGAAVGSAYRLKATLVSEYQCNISSLMATQASHSPNLPSVYAAGQSIVGPHVTVAAGKDPIKGLLARSRELAAKAADATGLSSLTPSDALSILAKVYRAQAQGANRLAALTNGEL